jgi:hypothetical protein
VLAVWQAAAAQAQMSVKDARADVARMRLLARHPGIASALAAGQVSVSCALEIAGLVRQLPKELRAGTGTILLEVATADALPASSEDRYGCRIDKQ